MFRKENIPIESISRMPQNRYRSIENISTTRTIFPIEMPANIPASFGINTRWQEPNKDTSSSFMLLSIAPLFLAGVAGNKDGEGALVWMFCCAIAFFLFGITGWKDEEIKK